MARISAHGRELVAREERAARAVAETLRGEFVARDTGRFQIHDFDIHVGDRVLALEVTSAFDDPVVQTEATLRRISIPTSSSGWIGRVDSDRARRHGFEVALRAAILAFEKVDCTSFAEARRAGGDAATSVRQLEGVYGVTELRATEPESAGTITLAQTTRRTWDPSSDALAAAVQRVLDKGDNQTKLEAAHADERHLFIDVDESPVAWSVTASDALVCPSDPRGVIDLVWVRVEPQFEHVLRRAVPGEPWHVVPDPTPSVWFPPRDAQEY